jgi:mRNA-degrading endonuclease YafQ of YafQ-DinJ toxin-antitoxin module
MSFGDFETQKKSLQEQIAAAETEAQFTMDMSEVESLNKQLEVLEANKLAYEDKVGQVEAPASENQVKQITELGGTEEELVKREEVQDEKVEEVKEALEEKNEEVQDEKVEEVKEVTTEELKTKIHDRLVKYVEYLTTSPYANNFKEKEMKERYKGWRPDQIVNDLTSKVMDPNSGADFALSLNSETSRGGTIIKQLLERSLVKAQE